MCPINFLHQGSHQHIFKGKLINQSWNALLNFIAFCAFVSSPELKAQVSFKFLNAYCPSSGRPSFCLYACPSACPVILGQDISSRILQLGIFGQHDERKMPIVFQGRWSKVKVVGILCRQDTE